MAFHGAQQDYRACSILSQIFQRIAHRLPDQGMRGKVQNGTVFAVHHDLIDSLFIAEIFDDDARTVRNSRQMADREIVKNINLVSLLNEKSGGVTSDISGPTCDQNIFVCRYILCRRHPFRI